MTERPQTLKGETTSIKTGFGNLYVTINEHDGKPVEMLATIGKSGKSIMAKTEAISRLISLCFREGISVDDIISQLDGINGEFNNFFNGEQISSIPDAIAKVLKFKYKSKGEKDGK